jgi:hypothetical protein
MPSSAWQAQKALYSILTGDAPLAALLTGGVHDGTPQHTRYPYLVLGELIETPDDTHSREGSQIVFTLHAWSQYAGMKELEGICERVQSLVHHQRWALDARSMIAARVDGLEMLRDPDGITRHAVMRVRTWQQEP